uniref:ferrochelatase n=1 Tax=Orrella sp. TaxID=1921583 RepID=UPI0040471CBE
MTVEVKDTFMAAGGEQFRYIPCLNDDPAWIDALTSMVEQHLQGWPTQEDHITGQ